MVIFIPPTFEFYLNRNFLKAESSVRINGDNGSDVLHHDNDMVINGITSLG